MSEFEIELGSRFVRGGLLDWSPLAVQDMPPQGVAFRQEGVLEIIVGGAHHAKLIHHATRPLVRRHGEGDDLLQFKLLKSKVEREEATSVA